MQGYIVNKTLYCLLGLTCFFLGACGSKVVGEDVSVSTPTGSVSAAQDPAYARYPMSGRSLDKALYIMNTPAYMQARQSRLDTFLRKSYAGEQAPNDYTNLQPRQVSPFRQ